MKLRVFVFYKNSSERVGEIEIKPEHTNEGIIEVLTDRLKKDNAIELKLMKNIMTILHLVKEEDGSITVEINLLNGLKESK